MKFKVIFIIFNIVIVCAFLFIFLSPLLITGPAGFLAILQQNYIIAIVFFLFLAVFNVFFFKNWRFYSYLENEDWGALITYLEDCIFRKQTHRTVFIKTILNAYIVTSNMAGIMKLEKHFIEKKARIIERFSLQFSIPYLLGNRPEEAEVFFASLVNQPGTRYREWMRWNLAFSLLLQNKIEPAKEELLALLDHSREFVLTLLVLYMLDPYAAQDEVSREKVSKMLMRYRQTMTRTKWEALFEESKKNIEVLILTKIITDASTWFFQEESNGRAGG